MIFGRSLLHDIEQKNIYMRIALIQETHGFQYISHRVDLSFSKISSVAARININTCKLFLTSKYNEVAKYVYLEFLICTAKFLHFSSV